MAAQRAGRGIKAVRDGDLVIAECNIGKLRPRRGNSGIYHALRFVLQLPDGRILGSFGSGIRFGLAGERSFLPAVRTGAGLGHLVVNRPCGRTVAAVEVKTVILCVTTCGNGLRCGRCHLPAAAVHATAGLAGRNGNDRAVHLFQRVQLVLVGVDGECQIKAAAGSLGGSCPRGGIVLRFRNTRHIRDLSAARNFFTDQCHNLPRIPCGRVIDFAVPYTFKAPGTGQSFAETADAGEHIDEFNQAPGSLWTWVLFWAYLIGTPHQKQRQPVTGCTEQDFFTIHYVLTSSFVFLYFHFYLLLKHWNHPLQ